MKMNRKIRDLIVTNFLAILAGLVLSGLMLVFSGINPLSIFGEALKTMFTDKIYYGRRPFKSYAADFYSPGICFLLSRQTCLISALRVSFTWERWWP